MDSLPTTSPEVTIASGVVELQQLDHVVHDDVVGHDRKAHDWLLNSPDPPSLLQELVSSVKGTLFPNEQNNFKHSSKRSNDKSRGLASGRVGSVLLALFPILKWGRNYKFSKFKRDLMAGLTLASLSIPQV